MNDPVVNATTSAAAPISVPGGVSMPVTGGSALVTPLGRTQVADSVVSKIAGVAARALPGVYQLGGGAARAFGAIRERIPGATTNAGQGVSVEVGERQAAVDLDMVVEYGVPITELAKAVRRNVITSLEAMTGLEVVEVNINVNDVHMPEDDAARSDQRTEPRVL